jgi:NADH-quinone oxidoreductase subunit L
MHNLHALFPADDFSLLAVVVAMPLIGAIVNGVFGKRLGNQAVSLMALASVALSLVGSAVAFLMLQDVQQGESAARFIWKGWHWFNVSTQASGPVPVEINLSLDALSAAMALVVTGVGFLIHVYSVGYMSGDPGYARFFAYMNLFIFSMLVLVLGDSLPVLFVGWEGVGLCSYLLIGFWYEKDVNAAAGKKAFITNRIGDFGLLVAMALLVHFTGALDWQGLEGRSGLLMEPFKIWPIGARVPLAELLPGWAEGVKEWVNAPRYLNTATLVGWAVFLGCVGKSAQIPLYVWLPDAMAGPTPVSALIHAATMVTAGVYLVCRMAPVFVLSPAAMFTVALGGALTAVWAASIALVQNDIKKVLAYSTVSQLGYMFLGAGVGAFAAGFFHVVTHAFFKACLFLGAGSVIHAMHARIHDTDASQDMRNMGGLWRFMPATGWTFLIACAAIVGFPLTSGFFSKDEILFKSYTSYVATDAPNGRLGQGLGEIELFAWPSWGGSLLLTLAALAAVMTAFYMGRLFIGTFAGEFKGWAIVPRYKPSSDEQHDEPTGPDARQSLEGPEPYESPRVMTWPLIILAAGAALVGFLNPHALLHEHYFDDWVNPVFAKAMPLVKSIVGAQGLHNLLIVPGVLAFLCGVGLAYWMYVMQRGRPARALADRAPALYRLMVDKWRIDELYEETVLGAVDSLAEICVWVDTWVVDGIIARLSALGVAVCGTLLRYAQAGRVHAYSAVMVAGLLALGWYLGVPHAQAKAFTDHQGGHYEVSAASGLGYQYRWDRDGDGEWDSRDFTDQRSIEFSLARDTQRTVKLQVKNAFGRTAVEVIEIKRPQLDRSAPPTTIEIGPDGKPILPQQQRMPRLPVHRRAGSPQGVQP